ncbi:MAG: 2-oxoacid:ferredoxin oxidoreductase subunit beta [Candidatus Bathyarchaeota archaeon]|nr:2-oxoacid:ferredoxin oxidoreductase subunit beta [Candidatus Bathyarchaeota archaeon]
MVTIKDYEGGKTAWCPGCGNFQILLALKHALVELALEPHQVLFVSGIGQSSKLPHYLKGNLFNGLHGRSLPVATGAKIANHALTVLVVGGDGDGYAEGGNHFVHAIRRNLDMTYIVHNNQIYGLTKGQASPTSERCFVTKTTPGGVILQPLNPIALAIALGATFVARGFSAQTPLLTQLIVEGIQHKGFALIDVLQPCVSFNHLNTYAWYKERVYEVGDEEDYDPEDQLAAFQKAQEWGDKIPIGVIYRSERPTYEEQVPVLKAGPLVMQGHDPRELEDLLEEFIP